MKKFLEKRGLLKDYLTYVESPTSFSLETFKVLPCKFKKMCSIDPHLCYFYHNDYERRRHPYLFFLKDSPCENTFANIDNSNSKECPYVYYNCYFLI